MSTYQYRIVKWNTTGVFNVQRKRTGWFSGDWESMPREDGNLYNDGRDYVFRSLDAAEEYLKRLIEWDRIGRRSVVKEVG